MALRCRRRLSFVHPTAAEHGALDFDPEPLVRGCGERILREHHQIGKFPRLDRSLVVLFEGGVRTIERCRAHRVALTMGLNGQNDLADMIRRLHERMSGRRLGKRECCMDHRVNASRFQKRPDVAADGIGDGCFLLHGS
jgi:hypothetical protein